MWPWAHAALGYLCYSLSLRLGGGGRPTGEATLMLGLGTQLPDLIDKPLAWYVDVLPYGRTFAHSLLTGVPFVLAPLVVLLVRRGRRDLAVALAVGYLSHLVGDGYLAILRGDVREFGYLFWPVQSPPSTEVVGLINHLLNIQGSPRFLFGLLLTAAALVLWVNDGVPGLVTVRDALSRRGDSP